MKQAFFFDIDGTLYQNRFHTMSEDLLDALEILLEKGNPVWIVSSRSRFEIQNLPSRFLNLPLTGWILEGGSLVLDGSRRMLFHFPLEKEEIQAIDSYCKEHELTWRYTTPDGNWFANTPAPEQRQIMFSLYLNCPDQKPADIDTDEMLNVLIWLDEQADLHEENLRNLLPDASIVRYPNALEIRASGHGKEDMVQWLRQKTPYSRVICFGDGENDVQMLDQADLGIAMGNGSKAAKEAADVVVGRIEEDGIVQWLLEHGWLSDPARFKKI